MSTSDPADASTEPGSSAPLVREGERDTAWPERVEIFDTTLRDGVQFEGILGVA